MKVLTLVYIIKFVVCQITSKHIGEIADKMCAWEGKIAEELGLTLPEVAEIKMKHDRELKLQM